MKILSSLRKRQSKNLILTGALFTFANLSFIQLTAQPATVIIDSSIHLVDGMNPLYSNVHPGDTIYLKAGNRDKLLIRNFNGLPGRPITFINRDGIVTVSTNSYYGISILNCRYTRLSGQGTTGNFYGIQVKKVAAGAGIGIGGMSSDFEVDHISVENCSTEGIVAKTDPDCSFRTLRDSFTQFNTSIHDNYIASVGNEGMYIGSSYYAGITITCNGKDTIVKPAVLNEVKIYNNIVEHTGWDGIQVSSAPLHCRIFNNTVMHDSQAEIKNQMSGILIGGGSKCDCYNNLVSDGRGDGIEDHGLGGNKIYNNIIVNAGKTYLPNDASQPKHGIFVSDVSAVKDSSFSILFNDIINPKSDGIRFQSTKSRRNLIASNLIVNPGNYNLYQSGNTSFTGNDAYVMIPNSACDVQLKNNFFSISLAAAGISTNDYSVLPASPLINKGYQQATFITTDFSNKKRPVGGMFDIGAMEYDSGSDRLFDTLDKDRSVVFPNPVHSTLNIRYAAIDTTKTILHIYTLNGKLLLQQSRQVLSPGLQELQMNVDKLNSGMYLYSIENGNRIYHGKFTKF